MDLYSSSYISDEQDGEPYHCSPAYDEQDIVCLGSDSDETPEEIAQKRQRYEAEAQRCIKGKLPILQSASLKGPFDTGWVNPWRYRPKEKQNEDWWQPGSEDMLFTRAKVMERAAAHGLRYLEPADALRWCKATAQAEAETINETNIQNGQIMRSVERDDLHDSEDTPAIDDSHQVHTEYRLSRSPNNPELSMLSHYSKTPHMSESLDSNTNIMKRPADSQWLKGSYVSKRARWEGPAVPSPTPLPDVLERDRRRRQLSARSLDQGKVRTHNSSRLSKSFPNHDSKEVPRHRLASVRNPVTPQKFRVQSDYGAISTFGRDGRTSQLRHEDFGHQPDDFDELQDNSQEDIFRAPPQSSVKSKKIQVPINDHSFSDLEPDDLIVITPRTMPNTGAFPNKIRSFDVHMSNTGFDDSYDLPELPRRKPISHRENGGEEFEEEDSFVTEVAPSSRNLEKFEFRKRRPKFPEPVKSDQDRHIDEGKRSKAPDEQSRQSEGRYIPTNTMQTTEETPTRLKAPTQEEVSSIRATSADERPLRESQATPPKSDKSGSSWDSAENVVQSSSFPRAANAAQTTSPPKSISSTSASPFTTPKKVAEHSVVASITGHLLRSFRKSGKREAAMKDLRLPPCSNDMSTQSFNTTPPRSILSPERKFLLLSREPFTQHSKAEPSPQRLILTEMDKVQLALSQICPSSSPADSPHNSLEGALQDSAVRDDLSSKGKGLELHLANGNALSPAVRPRSQIGQAPGLPDIEFTSFANESFLFLGDYLTEPVMAVSAAALDDGCETKPPAVILKHRSQVSTDEPQEGNGGLKHPQTDQESIQISKDISSRALEHESRLSADATSEEVEAAKSLEGGGHRVVNPVHMSQESADVTNGAAARPASVPKPQSLLSGVHSAKYIQDEAVFEGDDCSSNYTQVQPESNQTNNDTGSRSVASVQHQPRLSLDADFQDAQVEVNEEDIGNDHIRIPEETDKDNKKFFPGSAVILVEAAAVGPDNQRDEPTTGSETSWEGCDPQSPWAAEKIEPLSTFITSRQAEEGSPQHTRHDESYHTESVEPDNGMALEEISWVTIQRPSTPDYGGIKPFKDFSTPTPSPERRPADLRSNSMDTQSLADAATRNPWTSNSKNRSSAKPRKRVSFGIMPLDEGSLREKACSVNSTPRSPPPAQAEPIDQDEDIFHDGTTVTTTFNKHFIAATRPRHFKRILPEIRASQLDSSPAQLEAQAEAFIAADHDVPVDQWPGSAKATPSRHLKTRSDSNTNSAWNEGEDDDSMLSNPFPRSPSDRVSGRQTSLATFDMASALGEAVGFLEDWSVDTVLKPVKEKEPPKRVDNNGMRRRRLFRLM